MIVPLRSPIVVFVGRAELQRARAAVFSEPLLRRCSSVTRQAAARFRASEGCGSKLGE